MRDVVFVLTLFWAQFYFSINSILGITYSGSDASKTYVLGLGTLAFLSILLVAYKSGRLMVKYKLFTILIPIFFCFFYLIEQMTDSSDLSRYLVFYFVMCLPPSYIGVYLANHGGIGRLSKWLDVMMLILTTGLFMSLRQSMMTSNFETMVGGMSYQQASYLSAIAYSLNLCGLLYGKNYVRYKIMNHIAIKWICVVLLLVQFLGCISSGGRGGFLLVILVTIILFVFKIKSRNIGYLLVAIALFVLVFVLCQDSLSFLFQGSRYERAFSIFTKSDTASSRSVVWNYADRFIKNYNYVGAGIFKYYGLFEKKFDQPYAHNIFLELLCQGGLLYFMIGCCLVAKGIIRIPKIIRLDSSNILLIPLGLYSLVYLMLSGSYMEEGLFWFVLAYAFSYSLKAEGMYISIAK